jgi:hypothetical protein
MPLGNGRLPALAWTAEIEGLGVQPLDARGEACADLVQQALVIAVTEEALSKCGSLLKEARGPRVAVVTQLSRDCPAECSEFSQLVPTAVVGVRMPVTFNGHGPILAALHPLIGMSVPSGAPTARSERGSLVPPNE